MNYPRLLGHCTFLYKTLSHDDKKKAVRMLIDKLTNEELGLAIDQISDKFNVRVDKESDNKNKVNDNYRSQIDKVSEVKSKPSHQDIFICTKCNKEFQSKSSCLEHREICSGKRVKIINETNSTVPKAKRMLIKREPTGNQKKLLTKIEKNYTKAQKEQIYVTNVNLKKEDINNIYFCVHCNKNFFSKSECVTHKRSCNGVVKSSFKIEYVPKKEKIQFKNEVEDLEIALNSNKHVKKRKASKVLFVCTHCNKEFDTSISSQTHKEFCNKKIKHFIQEIDILQPKIDIENKNEIHENVVPNITDIKILELIERSKIKTEQENILSDYDISHTGKKLINKKTCICNSCNKVFSNRWTLKVHIRTHSGERPFSCKTCTKSFSQSGHLNIHERIHSGEKPYACDKCDMAFIDEKHLRRHVFIHSNKKYSCALCEKSYFTQASYFRHYEYSHNGKATEKKALCSICSKAFESMYRLKRHEVTHTQEKPFKCNDCPKSYTQAVHLSTHHSVVHKKEKPHPCSVCKKCFATSRMLTDHMRRHTGEKPFSCEKCGKAFGHRAGLRAHIKTYHKEIN